METHSQQMLRDVLVLPNCTRSIATWVSQVSSWARLRIEVQLDPVFGTIFCERDFGEDAKQYYEKRSVELDQIAKGLLAQPSESAAARLGDIEREVAEFHRNHAGYDRGRIYRRLGEWSADPPNMLGFLVAEKIPREFIGAFLEGVTDKRSVTTIIHELIWNPIYEQVAARFLFANCELESPFFRDAFKAIRLHRMDAYWLAQLSISVDVSGRLMTHPDEETRRAAALGEWRRDGGVRNEARQAWEKTVLEFDSDITEINEILGGDKALAHEWMAKRIESGGHGLWHTHQVVKTLAGILNREDRRDLLRRMGEGNYDEVWFDYLVGDDAELFRDWFVAQPPNYRRLRPLDREIDAEWERRAIIALDAGCSPEDIAEHGTLSAGRAINGPFSRYYLDQIPAYERLAGHTDPRLRPAGQRGLAWAKASAERELANERREERFG